MEYSLDLMTSFLKSAEDYSQKCSQAEKECSDKIERYKTDCQSQIAARITNGKKLINNYVHEKETALSGYDKSLSGIEQGENARRKGLHSHLIECMGHLSEIDKRVQSMSCYSQYNAAVSYVQASYFDPLDFSITYFSSLVQETEDNAGNKKKFEMAAASLAQCYLGARNYFNAEISWIFPELYANSQAVSTDRENCQQTYGNQLHKTDISVQDEMMKFFKDIIRFKKEQEEKRDQLIQEALQEKKERLKNLTEAFFRNYPPQDLKQEFMRIYRLEPDEEAYTCPQNIPDTLRIGDAFFKFSDLKLSDYARQILMKYYYFLIRYTNEGSREAVLKMPYSLKFDTDFNYYFELNSNNRTFLINRICSMAMRLFMMIPPGKINFTFLDPKLGETFALFGRLVETDDRSNKVINGKIWTDEKDMQDRLHIISEHISNITQRCLQGRYDTIRKYNEAAGQNAEPYQVLMIMDFPQKLNEQSLKMLKQIIATGPKCGVFTVILKNQEEYAEVDERRLKPIADSILSSLTCLFAQRDISFRSYLHHQTYFKLDIPPLYAEKELDKIIPVLKSGIKQADKVIIPYDHMLQHAEINHSTQDCIRIPIGIHGANNVQYLTLGIGGSQHALVAGITGSGKSTLLHNIIIGLLNQYSPDELSIYLIDFKRGVEFKIYADYVLPAFKVVAIESEREFGYNVLSALEREQKIRADLFTRTNTYDLAGYRKEHGKMPRILVIMDEFQKLFSDSNDELSKKSADLLEEIVRQGRSFGVHLMLATQSYSNIKGLDPSVYRQMAVRIVLKCSDTDADLMLENGSEVINQISLDDPGRAVYNSEAGNKAFNSHFRVAFIPTKEYPARLAAISKQTKPYADPRHPTRVLLTNIENNQFSIFKQFPYLTADTYEKFGQLYIGESLDLNSDLAMVIQRKEYSNVLMIGSDAEMARSMFTFALLSVCINYWILHQKPPKQPIITLLNAKPLYDSYFKDTIKLLAEQLPDYIRYIPNDDAGAIRQTVSDYFKMMRAAEEPPEDQYFFIFGYQRAEDLRSEERMSQTSAVDDFFNITQHNDAESRYSVREMMGELIKQGAQRGIHTIIWQDSFEALHREDSSIFSYFAMRVAFDMTEDEYFRFIGHNDRQSVGRNNAVLYSKIRDNQKFRPYRSPNADWLTEICRQLNKQKQ